MPKELIKIEARYQWNSDAWARSTACQRYSVPRWIENRTGSASPWADAVISMTAGEDPVDGQKLTIAEELDLEE